MPTTKKTIKTNFISIWCDFIKKKLELNEIYLRGLVVAELKEEDMPMV